MRIESKVGGVVVADARAVKPTTPPPAQVSSPASVVQLSAAATQAQDSEPVAPHQLTRLDEIRAAIKQDRYPIDLDKLASKMVDDEFVISNKVS
jgi:anti-sigma28 factor (negative regulator of flagellin synthesis)